MTATATKTKGSSTTVTLQRTELLAALKAVDRAVSKRPATPVLANCRIGDGLVIGTDLEVRIEVSIADHCEPFLVPYSRLRAIVEAASGETVKFTANGSTVTVQCGGGKWTLPTEDVAEFPTWEPANLAAVCRLPADQFHRAAKATTYATDTESSRYALGAVLLEVKDGNPTWVATDGRRLACVETETDQAVDDRDVLIPSRLLDIVSGMATGDGSVQIEANSKAVRFELENTTVTGTLIEGRFPRWRDLMSEDGSDGYVLWVNEWLKAVKAAAVVVSEQSKGVTLQWKEDTLTMSARSSEHGQSAVTCGCISARDTSPTKLDPKFLIDFLSHISGDEDPQVNVLYEDAQSPVVLKCGPYKGVIMPLSQEA